MVKCSQGEGNVLAKAKSRERISAIANVFGRGSGKKVADIA